ncbi:EI24 domain-containing protein [Halobacteriovorax sp. GB3]|uniref:EI24 domain-containing protein n=1 Tax=Halobacteriovorax sp. GB3 TaxID=2719615 RepID=UPI00235F6D4E|nr:EI24 domain-containing protein [Halobacteriovorax sp. GB3]MDD0852412.1 EI24 domain-containing protein [Halobacteriovorax sp. GB3]
MSLSIMFKDVKILLLSLIPSVIGLVAYYYLGGWFVTSTTTWGKTYIDSYFENAELVASILQWTLGIFFFFVASFTFFLFVSLISSPFNDLISKRVEKILGGRVEEAPFTFSGVFRVLKNEIKKIGFILLISIIGLLCGFVFPPLSFFISAILMAVTFLDYSWSRHEMSVSECVNDFKSSFVRYLLPGVAYVFIVSLPLINVIFLPLGVIYFTTIFTKKRV